MTIINWLLIHVGDAAQWLWTALKFLFGELGAAFDWALNPVLSPVLAFLNPACTFIGDAIYAALSPFPVWLGLTLLSAIGGVLMLIAFRYTSNQAAIGRARDDITANLLALKLFKDDIGVGLRSQGRLLGALGRLQWHMLRPVLIMLLPMLLGLAQMGLRYQWRPLQPNERTLAILRLSPQQVDVQDAEIESNAGLIVEAGPVAGDGELVWRVRGGEPGRHTLRFRVGAATIEKEVVVGAPFQRVSAERSTHRWTSQLFHPVEPLLAGDAPAQSIEIKYGAVASYIYGANWWILYFFVISMAFALLLKPVFKVRF